MTAKKIFHFIHKMNNEIKIFRIVKCAEICLYILLYSHNRIKFLKKIKRHRLLPELLSSLRSSLSILDSIRYRQQVVRKSGLQALNWLRFVEILLLVTRKVSEFFARPSGNGTSSSSFYSFPSRIYVGFYTAAEFQKTISYIYIFLLLMCFVSGVVCRKSPSFSPSCPVLSTYLQGKTWILPGSFRACGFTSTAGEKENFRHVEKGKIQHSE